MTTSARALPAPRRQARMRRLAIAASALFLFVVAAALRLFAVARLPVDYDEDDYLRAAQQMAAAIRDGDWGALTELNYRTEHPPLAKLAYGLALLPLPPAAEIPDRPTTAAPAADLPEPQLAAARTLSALLGSLQVLVVALLNPLAGFFLAIHTFTIKYTSQVMLEALPALLSTVAVVAYARSRRRANGWLLASAAALGLTAASKYLYAVAGVAIVVDWLWATRQEPAARSVRVLARRLAPIAAWGALSLLFFFAANPFLWPAPVERLLDSVLYHQRYAAGAAEVQEANAPAWQPLVWLFTSVPWHPGVFVFAFDGLIAFLALLGLKPLWQRRPLYVFWLGVALLFLLAWPTKWPQYILVLTAPLSLAAAAGVRARLWRPFESWVRRVRAEGLRRPAVGSSLPARAHLRRLGPALPWLLPGAVILVLIGYYPLFYQGGMALTDFSAPSIKDGVQGGIWREVRAGLAGEVEPVEVDIFNFGRTGSRQVHYAGLHPFLQFVGGVATPILVFEVVWTVLSVGLQAALGVGVALLLHQRGIRFRGAWRTLFILPWAIPEFVGALVWMQVFHPRYGWLFLGSATFAETPGYLVTGGLAGWQENPNAALAVLLVAGTWLGFPLILLAASAGLKMIPGEVYDAAALDGAGRWQQFRAITWPLLLPLLAPALIIRGIYTFNQFYLFYTLNPPYPVMTLSSLSYFIFQGAGRYATSAVINLFTVLVLILFLFWFNRASRAGEGVTYA